MDYLETTVSTLFRAVSLAGGIGALSRIIQVPQGDLLIYASGREVMPQEVFLRMVDFVLDDVHFIKPPGGERDSHPRG